MKYSFIAIKKQSDTMLVHNTQYIKLLNEYLSNTKFMYQTGIIKHSAYQSIKRSFAKQLNVAYGKNKILRKERNDAIQEKYFESLVPVRTDEINEMLDMYSGLSDKDKVQFVATIKNLNKG